MYETQNDLSLSIRSRMIELLNARLADAVDLRTQLKVAHWNVKGPQFIALHKLFDEIVEDADEYVDLIAERAVQLGGNADGTARQAAERSSLDEYSTGGSGGSQDHVQAVADVLAAFGRSAREAIDIALDANDQDTSDIFIEISRGTDKWLWMVEAHLQSGEWVRPSAGEQGEAARHTEH
jgi:starvation-inducible DNA-binding protein